MRSPIRTAKFAFAGGDAQAPTMLVELRGDGCQTMVPPSVHPCGERLAWERAGALLARHWPAKGTRDEAALALAGLLVRGGWPAEATGHFVQAVARVARVARDEEWRQRGAKGRQHDGRATLVLLAPAPPG